MADFSRFMRHILPHALNCPEPASYQYLRDAAIEFCKRTRAWRHTCKVNVQVGNRIVLAVPEGATLFEVDKAMFDRFPLERVSYNDIDFTRDPGGARFFAVEPDNTVIVSPEQDGVLTVVMYLVPSQDTEELPDFMLEDHGKYLGAGALKDLLMLPNQPYTNPQNAGMFSIMFEQHLNSNFALQKRGKQRAAIRTKPSWF